MIKNIIVIIVIIIIIARFEYTLTLGLLKFVFQRQTVYLSVKKLICAQAFFFRGGGRGKSNRQRETKGTPDTFTFTFCLPKKEGRGTAP